MTNNNHSHKEAANKSINSFFHPVKLDGILEFRRPKAWVSNRGTRRPDEILLGHLPPRNRSPLASLLARAAAAAVVTQKHPNAVSFTHVEISMAQEACWSVLLEVHGAPWGEVVLDVGVYVGGVREQILAGMVVQRYL